MARDSRYFCCVGAQKAGTTTLHAALVQQPAFQLPVDKETKFFVDATVFARGVDWYLAEHFGRAGGSDRILGEVDPDCLFFTESAERLASSFPAARIVVLLRNPIDRAYSHYLMSVRRGLESLTFMEALEAEPERLRSPDRRTRGRFSYVSRGMYARQLGEYSRWFPDDSVHVELFDDFVTEPLDVLARIQTFIGGPPPPADLLLSRENAGAAPRSRLVARVMEADLPGRRALRALVGRSIRPLLRRARGRNVVAFESRPALSVAEREHLVARFSDEIEDVSARLGHDLSPWLAGRRPARLGADRS